MIPPPRQGGGGTRAPALTYVATSGGVVVHVVVPERVVLWGGAVCLPHSSSTDVACVVVRSRDGAFSIDDLAFVKSASSSKILGRVNDSSIVSSHLYHTFQRIPELLRFICGQLFLRWEVTHALNEDLVDTVGKTLVDLTHPSLYVVERFLVRDIVVCVVSIEDVRRDLELTTVVTISILGGEIASMLVDVDVCRTHCCC